MQVTDSGRGGLNSKHKNNGVFDDKSDVILVFLRGGSGTNNVCFIDKYGQYVKHHSLTGLEKH